MTGSKDLPPSTAAYPSIFFNNQFRASPQWPAPGTSLSGKTAIVTGGNTGLGYEAARQLLGLNLSRLILAVRSLNKGEAAASKLRLEHPKAHVDVWHLDMASYESIQAFAKRVEADAARVDIVILNAGVIGHSYSKVESTGHEETMQVNYLSTVLLTILLLPILKAERGTGEPSHLSIINAALSLAASFPNRDKDPLLASFDDQATYHPQGQYMSTKVLAHMFVWKLVDYVSADDVIVNLADPAWCKGTELHRELKGAAGVGIKVFGALTGRTLKVGASCYVDAVVNKGKESHGCFLMSWKPHPYVSPFISASWVS